MPAMNPVVLILFSLLYIPNQKEPFVNDVNSAATSGSGFVIHKYTNTNYPAY